MQKLSILFLIGILLLVACGPTQPEKAVSMPTKVPTSAISQPPAATPVMRAKATSRGDKLEASDPASVKLGAGRPVLVEFFRFT